MTQEIALLRFRAARNHRDGDAVGMSRSVTSMVSLAQRCLDDRQSDFVLRTMCELLCDAAVAVDQMRRADAEASTTLADAARAWPPRTASWSPYAPMAIQRSRCATACAATRSRRRGALLRSSHQTRTHRIPT
jgi:hypothetical protein